MKRPMRKLELDGDVQFRSEENVTVEQTRKGRFKAWSGPPDSWRKMYCSPLFKREEQAINWAVENA